MNWGSWTCKVEILPTAPPSRPLKDAICCRYVVGCSSSTSPALVHHVFLDLTFAQGHCHARTCLGPLVLVKSNFNVAVYKDIQDNCVLSKVWGRPTSFWLYSASVKSMNPPCYFHAYHNSFISIHTAGSSSRVG